MHIACVSVYGAYSYNIQPEIVKGACGGGGVGVSACVTVLFAGV